MHKYIFDDLCTWAGVPRTISIYKEDVLGGQAVEYSAPSDIVKDVGYILLKMREKDWSTMTRLRKASEFCNTYYTES